jgi:hypothetical protein|tara:strand:+ start:40 stop:783 length:744 start_codon:yes stop_codon:yes gene_type:complete
MADSKFPSEVIDLPSEGKLYPKEHPCSDGKIEIKYMTAKEEDILTSQNLIKKGVVIDRLMDSLILTPGVKSDDLILGDKNAVMVAARILAYGPEYVCDVVNPNTSETINHTFNLADCPFKKLPEGITENKFKVDLPISKKKVTFKLLTGKEEVMINEELKASEKINAEVKPELTTRLRHTITSVDGDDSQATINGFVQNLLARDSMYLRKEIQKNSPDIELEQEIDIEGESVKVNIPMTVGFFWPDI